MLLYTQEVRARRVCGGCSLQLIFMEVVVEIKFLSGVVSKFHLLMSTLNHSFFSKQKSFDLFLDCLSVTVDALDVLAEVFDDLVVLRRSCRKEILDLYTNPTNYMCSKSIEVLVFQTNNPISVRTASYK